MFQLIDPERLKKLAANEKKNHSRLATRLKNKKSKKLDDLVHSLHENAFNNIDCLDCANCCKSLGPRITNMDIERMARSLKMKTSEFEEQFTRVDEDNDIVFKSMPCPMLDEDNYCRVYESRPKACREYPHTDRKNFIQILSVTLKNTSTCPVVYQIMEELKKREREL
ncbi:MAG: YkgJ family cysteine cluster protein [Bacteroidales bacterium]|nr:YkgJ family cysteine cluster protein [Bacteroidales bacterium]